MQKMENKTLEEISKIFYSSNLNSSLFPRLSSKINDINKRYFLSFLIEENLQNNEINKFEDFWFIKHKSKNIEIIKKYIDLSIDYIKSKSNLNSFKFCNSFLDAGFENRIILMSLILDKYGLFDNLIYLFLGFIIGEKENFIKNKYIYNLQSLLSIGKFKKNIITVDMPIYELNEKVLEILNLCLYLKEKFNKIEENEDNENEIEEEDDENEEKEEEGKKSEKEKNEDDIQKKICYF